MMEMLNMQINTWFGGVGVGFMNYYAFLIIAVFISGLMVGRTPEFLGKKVEAREMKIATIVALAHPFVILIGTAVACYYWVYNPAFVEAEGGWLNNPGFHGFSEMLYEYTSASANNGSGFEGLGDNTYFWNFYDWSGTDYQPLSSYRRAGCHCGTAGTKEIYPGKCRDIEDRYGHICRDDVQRNLYRCRPVFLPCADAGVIAEYFSIY